MKSCKVPGMVGNVCRGMEQCKIAYQLTDQDPDEGCENDVVLAQRHGTERGLASNNGHGESMVRGYKGCADRKNVFEILKKQRQQIIEMMSK